MTLIWLGWMTARIKTNTNAKLKKSPEGQSVSLCLSGLFPVLRNVFVSARKKFRTLLWQSSAMIFPYITLFPYLFCLSSQILCLAVYGKRWPQRSKKILLFAGFFPGLSLLLLFREETPEGALLLSLILLFWLAAALQDLCTWTFSAWWFVPGVILLLLCAWMGCLDSFSLMNLLYPLLCVPMIILKQMGSADFWFVLFAAFLLSAMEMAVCFILASFTGIVWGLMDRKNLIPFVSCLSAAFVLSLLLISTADLF